MDEIQVMTVIQLKGAGDALVKKMVHAVCNLPFKLAGMWFQYHLKMLYLVVDSYFMIKDALQSALPSNFTCSENDNEPEATVSQEKVVQGVKKFRRTILVNIDHYYSLKLRANNEEASKRLDELRNAKGREEFQAALDRVNKMNERFREERRALYKDVEDLSVDEIIEQVKEKARLKEEKARLKEEKSKLDNEVGEAGHNQVSNLSSEPVTFGMNTLYKHFNDFRKHIASKRKNGVSKNRLYSKSGKIEEIFKVSSNLVQQLDRLNHQVSHLSQVSERMAEMQYELGVGRKLLCEVEADRNDMKRKLVTLERLIKEEEKYLNRSHKSGFNKKLPISS